MDGYEEETMTVTIVLDSPQPKQNQDPGVVVEVYWAGILFEKEI